MTIKELIDVLSKQDQNLIVKSYCADVYGSWHGYIDIAVEGILYVDKRGESHTSDEYESRSEYSDEWKKTWQKCLLLNEPLTVEQKKQEKEEDEFND